MADGDFDYCLLDLASLLGVKTFAALPSNEQAQVKALFNEAYRQCFIRPGGKRVRWGEGYVPGVFLPAPITFTFTATQGANTLTSPSPALSSYTSYVGSRVKIGTTWYTLATVDGTPTLVEPFAGDSGAQTATLYFSSFVLPGENLDLLDEPEILGWGRLTPMSGRGQEIRNRNWGTGDFQPERGQSPRFAGYLAEEETGDPLFYYIDSAKLSASGTEAIRNRINVYPLPDTKARSLRIRGHYVPAAITSGSTVPVLPAGAILDILLPMARAKVVKVMRRFSGTNRREIIEEGRIAEQKLDGLTSVQQRMPVKIRLKAGW